MKKHYFLFLGIFIILIIAIIGFYFNNHTKKSNYSNLFPPDSYRAEIPKQYSWKHYVENKHMKFEVDYPDYLSPSPADGASHDDIGAYSVMFGNEFYVSATQPSSFKNMDEFLKGYSKDLFIQKTKFQDYDAAVFIDRDFYDNSIAPDYRMSFIANNTTYTIWFFHPLNDRRILDSFKVLK